MVKQILKTQTLMRIELKDTLYEVLTLFRNRVIWKLILAHLYFGVCSFDLICLKWGPPK